MPILKPIYVRTSHKRGIAILIKEGFKVDKLGEYRIPRTRWPAIEAKLHKYRLPYIVAYERPVLKRISEERKQAAAPKLGKKSSPAKRSERNLVKKDEWDKYNSGWGPDPFHTVGD